MRTITKILYIYIIKPILFMFPADDVHELFLKYGRKMGQSSLAKGCIKTMWRFDNEILAQDIEGMHFKNPIGLSAGFDYNADLPDILPSIGFGFHTIGTLTHDSYEGNPRPMLARLPKSKSLLVNKGFKNKGVKVALSTLSPHTHEAVRGVSIGATNKPYADFESMVDNLVQGFVDANEFKDFDYFELNISCPNLQNIQNLKDQIYSRTGLPQVLAKISSLSLSRPVFIKMPLERTEAEMKEIIQIADGYPFIRGLIFSNLAKDRSNPAFDKDEIKNAGKGNFSGKPVEKQSNELLRYAFNSYGHRFVLVGVGGVFTAEDAYNKILLGASLVQIITGMVYNGPSQIGIINKNLTKLLKRDGYKNIKEAIGAKA